MLLIALAAGVFVLRMTEHRIIFGTLHELGSRYRAMGFVNVSQQQTALYNDVSAAAEVISHSPYIAFEDRRRGVEGVFQNVLNRDIEGMRREHQGTSRVTHAFFYAEIVEFLVNTDEFVWFRVRVCDVVAGYPEHVIAGQYLRISSRPTEACIAAGEMPIAGLAIGQRYFFRAAFYYGGFGGGIPRAGNEYDEMVLRPLNHITHPLDDDDLRFGTGPTAHRVTHAANLLPENPLWYIALESGETIDYMAAGMEWLAKEIIWLRHHQAGFNIRTTRDMTAMPVMWESVNAIAITQGRPVDKNDYLAANPVIVIHEQVAEHRDLAIGDTISIGIPRRQLRSTSINLLDAQRNSIWDYLMVSTPDHSSGAFSDTVLKLEIIGLYTNPLWGRHQTHNSVLAFIPDSVLPNNYTVYDWIRTGFSEDNAYIYFARIPEVSYIPHVWYSFVLHDPLDRMAFLERYTEPLAAMGYALIVPETGAENFWATANPILQAITFNIIVFGVVTVLLLALVCWLFLRQRRKDFAILRALGCSGKKAFGQLMVALFVFGLPAVIIGGVAAWFIAQRQANSTLNPFEEIVHGFEPTGALAGYWLGIFVTAAFVVLLLMFVAGAVKMSRRAVLEMLQG